MRIVRSRNRASGPCGCCVDRHALGAIPTLALASVASAEPSSSQAAPGDQMHARQLAQSPAVTATTR